MGVVIQEPRWTEEHEMFSGGQKPCGKKKEMRKQSPGSGSATDPVVAREMSEFTCHVPRSLKKGAWGWRAE